MKGRRMLTVGLAVLAILAGVAVVAVSGPAAVYVSRAQVTNEAPPEDVVSDFYAWYLGSIDLKAGRNPLVDRAYRSSGFLSEDFVARVDALLDSFQHGGYDPFLLAQDVPESVEVGEAVVSGDTAQVPMETSFEGHRFLVALKRIDGAWKIDDVDQMPDAIVESFYNRYLAYVDNNGGPMQNPLVDGFYRDCPELSDAFVVEVDETLASFDKGGFDPILLAQDMPARIAVGEAEILGDEARVTLEMFWGGNPEPSERVVTLRRIDGDLAIVDIAFETEV